MTGYFRHGSISQFCPNSVSRGHKNPLKIHPSRTSPFYYLNMHHIPEKLHDFICISIQTFHPTTTLSLEQSGRENIKIGRPFFSIGLDWRFGAEEMKWLFHFQRPIDSQPARDREGSNLWPRVSQPAKIREKDKIRFKIKSDFIPFKLTS